MIEKIKKYLSKISFNKTNTPTRTDLLNTIARKEGKDYYLEIGFRDAMNFERVQVPSKLGVDPDPLRIPPNDPVVVADSDQYFKHINKKLNWTFDLIFVDGLHHRDQVLRDVKNSIELLNPGGFIIVHDCNPLSKRAQIIPRPQGQRIWNGDVWKAWINLRQDLEPYWVFYVIDIDHGCGVIYKSAEIISKFQCDKELTWKNFQINREEWLNLISYEEFRRNQLNIEE